MKKLPLLISVPHAGEKIPPEAEALCILTKNQIVADGDEGASEIYNVSRDVENYVTTPVARAIVDLNRSPDDRSGDGVIKKHTCHMEPVYKEFPDEKTVRTLLARYYYPYHDNLTCLAHPGIVLGIDCHTMCEKGPPVGPDPGTERPWVCLSNRDGTTCPQEWLELLGECFSKHFKGNVSLNHPFKGGYISKSHSAEIPWIQLEISRASFMTNKEKRNNMLASLTDWLHKKSGV